MDKEKVIKRAERIMCSTVDRDMIDSFCEDVIALLKEQKAVVRCKNCRYWEDPENCSVYDLERPEDWFCADGERKEGR